MPQPPLNALRAFEAVVRTGGFNAAAKALHVTPSAISHQVRHLEDWLGAPLFERGGGRAVLLDRGAALARSLAGALGEIEAACERAGVGAAPGPLVVAAIPSVATCWLIPRLPAFRREHPEVAIRIVYAIHGQSIDFSEVHLAFVYCAGLPALTGVRAEPFLPGLSAPVCAPSLLPSLCGREPDAASLRAAGLLHDTHTEGWREWCVRAGAPPGSKALEGPVFEDFNLLREAALAGQGVALCPLAVIRDDLEEGRLVRLSPVTVMEGFGYHLLSPERPSPGLEPAARVFRAWALDGRDVRLREVSGGPALGATRPRPIGA